MTAAAGLHPVAADAGLLDLNGTLVAEIIAFLIMLFILGRWAYPPIMRAAEERQRQIDNGLRAAAEAERRLEQVQADVKAELDQAREQAREILSRARAEAVADAEEARSRARREAQAQLEKARGDIDAERDRALQELRAEVGTLVVEAASRVLRQAIDEKTHKRLIEDSLGEVGARN